MVHSLLQATAPLANSAQVEVAGQQVLFSITESMVYLMGLSFVLGCMFTILVLITLDFMHRHKGSSNASE
jgi:hypothetical protein